MYIAQNLNFNFLENQNASKDISPQIIRVEKEKDSDGNIREVLVLKMFCRVDKQLLMQSNCDKIDIRLSKFDLSYYRTKSKLTQTKVAVAKIQQEQKQESSSDSSDAERSIQSRHQKRKDRRGKRKNRREEKRNRRKDKRENRRKGAQSLFTKNQNDSGDTKSRRRGGNKNRDRKSKFQKSKALVRSTPVKKPLNSKVVLEPKNLVVTSKSAANFNLIKNQDIYSEAKKVSSINLTGTPFTPLLNIRRLRLPGENQSVKQKMLRPGKVLKIQKVNYSNTNKNRPVYRRNPNVLRNYRKHYNNLIDKSIDPIVFFQNSIDKQSFNEQRKGIKNINANSKNITEQSKTLIREVRRQINGLSNSRYEFKKVTDTSRYKILECVGRISLEDFKAIGRKAYILYIAKDASGINLQSQEYAIQTSEVLKQRIRQSTKASCSVKRKPSGVASFVVSNSESKHPLDIDVEVKKLKRQSSFIESHFDELLGNRKIPAKSILTLNDGTPDSNPRRPINFNSTESLFFRTTLNYRDRKYNNTFAASVKGVKGSKRNNNIPTLNIVALQDEKGRGFSIQISNISNNIAALKLVKYRYVGRSKGKMLDTFDLERNVNDYVFLDNDTSEDLRKSVTFFDTDVFEDRVYMYTVMCIMENGEKKLSTDYFIEKFEERTETVIIDQIQVDSPNFISDASNSVGQEREATRSIQIDFRISKIETEVDKVISNLFGNLFDIYKEELTKIKDVQGLVYSIEIQRIEMATGDSVTVGKVTADKFGNCTFTDTQAPAFSDLAYKLIPRVRPANEVISSIVAQTPFLAKKTINKPVNFISAAARVSAKNRNNNIFTAKKDKFNDRKLFKRGSSTTN